jgi:hypothetical protein
VLGEALPAVENDFLSLEPQSEHQNGRP